MGGGLRKHIFGDHKQILKEWVIREITCSYQGASTYSAHHTFCSYPQFLRGYDSNLNGNRPSREKACLEKGILVLLLYNHTSSQNASVVSPDYHWYQHILLCTPKRERHNLVCVGGGGREERERREFVNLKLYHNKIKSIIIMGM